MKALKEMWKKHSHQVHQSGHVIKFMNEGHAWTVAWLQEHILNTINNPTSTIFGMIFDRYKGDMNHDFKLMQVINCHPFDEDLPNSDEVYYTTNLNIYIWFMFPSYVQ